MKKTATILSSSVAILFILIGLLHTEVHFRELDGDSLRLRLIAIDDVELLGERADLWRLWQGFSFMMGFGFVVIGVLRLVSIRTESFRAQIIGACTMALLLITVIISGRLFFSAIQVYGGLFGLTLQVASLVFLVKSRVSVR